MKLKDVIFLGDSITEGSGASAPEKCYVSLIAKEEDFRDVYNGGIGGTRISRQNEPVNDKHRYDIDFNVRLNTLPEKADYVVVFGGTNDYGHGDAPLGEVGEINPYTFAGAVRLLAINLRNKYGYGRTRFVLPLKRYNPDKLSISGHTLKEYVDVMKKVLELEGIPYLDLFEKGLDEPLTENDEGYFADGLHPNDKGHEWLAKAIADFIRETE